MAWHPGGRVTGRASLSGTTREPVVRATVSGADLTIARQPATGATLDVAFERGVVRAAPVDLTQADGGRATGQVSYTLDTGRSEVSLRANGWRLSPHRLPAGSWPVSGLIDGTLDAAGTVEHPTGGGRITLADVRWQDSRVDRAVVDLTLSDAGVAAVAQVPSLGARRGRPHRSAGAVSDDGRRHRDRHVHAGGAGRARIAGARVARAGGRRRGRSGHRVRARSTPRRRSPPTSVSRGSTCATVRPRCGWPGRPPRGTAAPR